MKIIANLLVTKNIYKEEEMNEYRDGYGEDWTNEQIMFENIYNYADSYLQDLEVIITK